MAKIELITANPTRFSEKPTMYDFPASTAFNLDQLVFAGKFFKKSNSIVS